MKIGERLRHALDNFPIAYRRHTVDGTTVAEIWRASGELTLSIPKKGQPMEILVKTGENNAQLIINPGEKVSMGSYMDIVAQRKDDKIVIYNAAKE